MAVPHYTYRVLKMPGPNRIIMVKGSFELSYIYIYICNKEFHKMAQTFGMIAEYGQPKGKIEKETTSTTRQQEEDKVANIELEAKKLQVHIEDPNKSTTNESGTPTA
jgi:hypothetical protein